MAVFEFRGVLAATGKAVRGVRDAEIAEPCEGVFGVNSERW